MCTDIMFSNNNKEVAKELFYVQIHPIIKRQKVSPLVLYSFCCCSLTITRRLSFFCIHIIIAILQTFYKTLIFFLFFFYFCNGFSQITLTKLKRKKNLFVASKRILLFTCTTLLYLKNVFCKIFLYQKKSRTKNVYHTFHNTLIVLLHIFMLSSFTFKTQGLSNLI